MYAVKDSNDNVSSYKGFTVSFITYLAQHISLKLNILLNDYSLFIAKSDILLKIFKFGVCSGEYGRRKERRPKSGKCQCIANQGKKTILKDFSYKKVNFNYLYHRK